MINKLCDIYNRWGDKNNLQPLGSADEEVMWNNKLTDKQVNWLERFIIVWDKAEKRDYKMMCDENRKGKKDEKTLDLFATGCIMVAYFEAEKNETFKGVPNMPNILKPFIYTSKDYMNNSIDHQTCYRQLVRPSLVQFIKDTFGMKFLMSKKNDGHFNHIPKQLGSFVIIKIFLY